MAMIIATMPSMRSVDLSLAGLRLPAGSWATATLAAIQRVTGLPPWASLLGDDQLLELARGRRHRAEPLAELDHFGALVLEPERDVGGVPGVVGDLADLEEAAIAPDPLLDRAVVDDVALGRLDEALGGPQVVGDTVALGALPQVLRRHEVVGEHPPEVVVMVGREHPGERGDVGGGREVEPAEARAPAQLLERDRTITGVPGRHVDPALGLLGPFVQMHAPKRVLGAGQGDRLLGLAREVVFLDREPEVRIGLAPDRGIGPVVVLVRCGDEGKPAVVLKDALRAL